MANQFVAFHDDRHGLGSWVAEQIAADLFRYGVVTKDGEVLKDEDGKPLRELPPGERVRGDYVASTHGMSLSAAGTSSVLEAERPRERADQSLNFAYRTWTSPRADADATFAAVIGRQAQVGVVPLYDTDMSFNKDTLNALIDFPANDVIREYVAESNYVLAAPTDLIHEIEQAGYTDTFAPAGSSSPFTWNAEKQRRYLRKVTTVYASADAMRHCQAAIDGFRAQGIDVQLIPEGTDAYREGLRLASEWLDPNRRIETHFSGSHHTRISKTRGANHNKPVIAVLLSADKAMGPDGYHFDNDYVVLENEMAGADRIRTSFIALTRGVPSIPKPTDDPVRFEMKALERHFLPPRPGRKGASADHRALYPIAGDAKGPKKAGFETPAFVRVLYKINTVGADVGDFSRVLGVLNEQKLSYQTTTLDARPGHPMIIAIDVPAANYSAMRPVLKTLMRQSGAQRLADFPALQPMVETAIRPAPRSTSRSRIAAFAIVAVLIALAGFVAGQL
jgi:hypothetical protein